MIAGVEEKERAVADGIALVVERRKGLEERKSERVNIAMCAQWPTRQRACKDSKFHGEELSE